jgi:hypothetical protein
MQNRSFVLLLVALCASATATVHQLTDSSFEHDTQAATGATTGDWLVFFGNPRVHGELCHQLEGSTPSQVADRSVESRVDQ